MSKVNSTARARARKPKKPMKPYADLPLFPHASGRWCWKIRRKFYYFGSWADGWESALKRPEAERVDLLAGRKPATQRVKEGEARLCDLVNQFLSVKKNRVETGELTRHSFKDYFRVCESLITTFGREIFLTEISQSDFERLGAMWGKKWGPVGPVRLGNEINVTRVGFNYAFDKGLIDRPMRYGQGFEKPDKKTLRIARNAKGERLFQADEL